jgi:hypothetical protein
MNLTRGEVCLLPLKATNQPKANYAWSLARGRDAVPCLVKPIRRTKRIDVIGKRLIKQIGGVKFQVLAAATKKIITFWDTAPCSLVETSVY